MIETSAKIGEMGTEETETTIVMTTEEMITATTTVMTMVGMMTAMMIDRRRAIAERLTHPVHQRQHGFKLGWG